jgi:HSP20 family protein
VRRLDVHKDKDTMVAFDMPDLQKEDMKADVHNDVLTVSGETRSASASEPNEEICAVRERRYGKPGRTVSPS